VERSQAARAADALTATTFIALLRGVNVGAANRLSSEALRQAFAAAGATDVQTLLQSGNVVFVAPAGRGAAIAAAARAIIASDWRIDAPIVWRDAAAWQRLVGDNPFLAAGVDPDRLHVACLSASPDPARAARLDRRRSPPDAFEIVGADVYLSLPNGVARSKLTNAWFDAELGVVSTLRNWRTVTRLAAMIDTRR